MQRERKQINCYERHLTVGTPFDFPPPSFARDVLQLQFYLMCIKKNVFSKCSPIKRYIFTP